MTKLLPSSYQPPLEGVEWHTRSPIRAVEWTDLIGHQNLLRAVHGERMTAVTYYPHFEPESSSFSPTPDNDVMPLDEWRPLIRSVRPRPSDGDWLVALAVYGTASEVQVDLEAEDSSHDFTVTAQTGGSLDWSVEVETVDSGDAFDDGDPLWWTVDFEARFLDEDPEIIQIALFGAFLEDTDL